MAGERTFAAWIRTGLALTVTGLASARLMTSVEPLWLVRVMGAIFGVLGVRSLYRDSARTGM